MIQPLIELFNKMKKCSASNAENESLQLTKDDINMYRL